MRWFKGLVNEREAKLAQTDSASDSVSSASSRSSESSTETDSSDSDSDSSAYPQRADSDAEPVGAVDELGRAVRSRSVSDEELLQPAAPKPSRPKPAVQARGAADYSELF